jgi:beta-galactosidase
MQLTSFDRDWRFHLGDPTTVRRKPLDDSDWRALDLPHDWSIELPRAADNPSNSAGGFFEMGRGWYRKTFEAPEAWRGKQVFVLFEGAYMNAEVRLNGDYLARHPYGYTSFWLDLTPYLNIGGSNTLQVVVDNASQINSRWYSGSGLYRHVWLAVADPVHISQWGVYVTTPEVRAQAATVRVATTLWNRTNDPAPATLRSSVIGPDGREVARGEAPATVPAGSKSVVSQELVVTGPQLWSPETPHLYRVESELLRDGQPVDAAITPFGIRSVEVDAVAGLRLNGRPIKLRGGCVHHDNGVLGSASFDRAEERKVEVHKASGYNAIRCAHNPPAPAFLEACDRLGMLVIDEAFDCWREGKNPYDYHVAYDDWWRRDLDSMLLRDRNHPSIILWSIGNEVLERDGRSGGEAVARALVERVHGVDPTRPVTSAICGIWDEKRTWLDTDPVFACLDVGGYNYQEKRYRDDHARVPGRIMVGLESTAGEAFEHCRSVEDLPYVIGDFVWTSLDYLGEAGIGRADVVEPGEQAQGLGKYPWHQANCGDLDLCGFKRPQSYYRDVLWRRGEALYIVVHPPLAEGKAVSLTYWGWPDVWPSWNWPGHEGETFRVDVYTRCPEVELSLNGRSLGVRPATANERYIATFEVPYAPGQLVARAVGSDGPVECALETAGLAAGLRLSPDRATIRAAAGDLSYVTVEVVDGNGRVQPEAGDEVIFSVSGPGKLLAVGSGDPVSTEDYCVAGRHVWRGRALVVVASTGESGTIRLCAEATGLPVAEVSIRAE